MSRLPALLVGAGIALGLILALPTLAALVAPWLGGALLLVGAGVGVACVVLAVGHVQNVAWRAALEAGNERIRLTLEARRAERIYGARDVTVYEYYQEGR